MSARGTTGSPAGGRWGTGAAALLVLGIGVLCLVLAALGSIRADEPLASFDPASPPESTSAPSPPAPEGTQEEMPTFEMPPPAEPGIAQDIVRALGMILGIIAGLAVVLLIAWIIQRTLALRREAQREQAAPEELEELTAAQAASAIDDAVVQLTRTDRPGDAVIAAWLALEGAIAQAGIRRGPTQTTQEFVVAVLAGLHLDRADLEDFARLYGQALFSGTPITEDDRTRAITLLTRLSAPLRASAEEGR